jgi:adenylate cyclase
LRRLARRLEATLTACSLRLSEEGETWLVEGVPSTLSRQFVFLGLAPETPIRRRIEVTVSWLRFVMVSTLFLTLVLAWWTIRDLCEPVRRLEVRMAAVEAGDYSVRLSVERRDELGMLAVAFNEMARGLAEAEVLGRMVSVSARDAIAAASEPGRAEGSEYREVTIVLLGIPQFSRHLATSNPGRLLARLDRQVRQACREVVGGGGDVDKLLGDKMLAVFDHRRCGGASSAAGAAIAVAASLERGFRQGRLAFPFVVGVNSGTVVAGWLGSGTRRDHTVIGDPVNLAARAEVVAEGLGTVPRVVLTDNTAGHLDRAVSLRQLAVTSVKGMTRPVALFQLGTAGTISAIVTT